MPNEYNANNQLTKEIYEDSSTTTYEYSETNSLLTYISDNISGKTTQFNYNKVEKRLDIDNSIGLRLSYSFDELGRKTQITIKDGTNPRTTNYSYDSLGRLNRLTDGSGNLIVDYDYHPLTGLLSKETNGNGTYTTYTYDLAGQLTSAIFTFLSCSFNTF